MDKEAEEELVTEILEGLNLADIARDLTKATVGMAMEGGLDTPRSLAILMTALTRLNVIIVSATSNDADHAESTILLMAKQMKAAVELFYARLRHE